MKDQQAPVVHEHNIPDALKHLSQMKGLLEAQGLPRKLSHLIELRVSQINQCGFCVKMHSADARRDGETTERLDRLVVWREVEDFSEAERAVFHWAEALTKLEPGTEYGAARASLREHYSDEMISLITSCVAMINLWNRFQISAH